MRRASISLLMFFVAAAFANEPKAVGDGQYQLSGNSRAAAGTPAKIAALLMEQAHGFCKKQNGAEAVLLQQDGSDSEDAVTGGRLVRPGHGASATIHFRCDASTSSTNGTPIDHSDTLANLKSLLDSGTITRAEFDKRKAEIPGSD